MYITRQIIADLGGKKHDQRYVYYFVNTENKFIKQILQKYLNEGRKTTRLFSRDVAEIFEESFGKYKNKIFSIEGFSSTTLFTQIEFYKKHFANDNVNLNFGIRTIINFYRWLIREYPENNFFSSSFDMSETLLFNPQLPVLMEKNYFFTVLSPTNIPYGKDKICFLLKGFSQQSTQILNDDYVSLDLSHLQSIFYRDLLLEYLTTSQSITTIMWVGIPAYICDAMEALYKVKQKEGYPNPKFNYLTNQEAVFIRQFFDAQNVNLRTKNNKIGAVRRYIAYCVDKKAITVDELFFDYLIQYEEPNKTTAKAVSDEILVKINKVLLEKSKDSLFYKEIFVIFHLALQTEFRINQICHLKVDCIKPTFKPNQFAIHTNSKTSNGRKNSYDQSSIRHEFFEKNFTHIFDNNNNKVIDPIINTTLLGLCNSSKKCERGNDCSSCEHRISCSEKI